MNDGEIFRPIDEHLADADAGSVGAGEAANTAEPQAPQAQPQPMPEGYALPRAETYGPRMTDPHQTEPRPVDWSQNSQSKGSSPSAGGKPGRPRVNAAPLANGFQNYFKGILEQIKALFSPDPANMLAMTFRGVSDNHWYLWLPLYVFLLPTVVLQMVKSIPFPLMSYLLGYGLGARIYFTTLLTLLFSLAGAYGSLILAARKSRKPLPPLRLLNLLLTTTIPMTLLAPVFALLLLIPGFGNIILILFLPLLFLTGILVYTLYQRELSLAAVPRGNWWFLLFFCMRVLVFILSAALWTKILF